ncbi:MAG: quinol:cytochrome C oxidoreductase [Flavobacteriaceae bacterium]|nr:quinol:cytochrome C oxidoreductase [Flavobacteriaceae bacterium]
MYQFSSKLKMFSIILMVVGLIGMAYGFFTVPKDAHAMEEILKEKHNAHDTHGTDSHAKVADNKTENHNGVDTAKAHKKHVEHVLMQYKNRPWSAIFINAFFFFMIGVMVLIFYAIQWVAEAGWSIVLFRVMEAITAYILPGSILLFIFLVLSGLHFNHIYVWMGEHAEHDAVIQAKKWWLNVPGFLIRSALYIIGYNVFRYFLVKNSLKLDNTKDYKTYIRNKNIAVGFVLFFAISELFLAFDWLMSLDPHWFSQLYSFYVLASMLVTAITVIAVITIYLKSRGYLPEVNSSHLHDLAKYMFGFSIFWTYFWFSQFMLQWYSHQPEETVYFVPRLLGTYQIPFIGMLVLNFVLPVLILMSNDFKRLNWFIMIAGISIIIGHYIDIFVLIAPATVGDNYGFGVIEIATIAFFLGLFIFVVFKALAKHNLQATGNPFMKESEIYHY